MSEPQVRIRPEIDAIPTYVPGKSQPGAAKMSSNENPNPPGPAAQQAMAAAIPGVNRYPDMGATDLIAGLADYHGVESDQIAVSTGSSAVLLSALSVVAAPGAEVIYAWRSFESYPIAIPAVGATPVPVPLDAEWRHDLAAMAAAVTDRTAAVILCTPNNPTGPAIPLAEIRAFAARIPDDVLVIVDEAYIDFADPAAYATAIREIATHPNLLVLRTFSKAFALAGLRVGYGIGHPRVIDAIRKVSVPFGVSSVAQAGALAALGDADTVRAQVAQIRADRDRIATELRAAGYRVPDTQSNFVWIPADQSGPEFVAACADAGVIVRPFPEGVRVSTGSAEENGRFLQIARAFAAAR